MPMFSGVYNLQKGKNVAEAAAELCMSRSWGIKWYKRYQKEGMAGLENRSRSGRPPKINRGIMKKVRREPQYWTAEEMHDHIFKLTNVSFSLSYIRRIMKSWGYTMKAPVRMHIKRASRRRIKKFQKNIKKSIERTKREGYTICMQDEAIVIADARARKEMYTLKHKRTVYTYTGNHQKTIVFVSWMVMVILRGMIALPRQNSKSS